jgi:hypothetical protein
MTIKPDDSLLVEVIESHEDRVRVIAMIDAMIKELRAENLRTGIDMRAWKQRAETAEAAIEATWRPEVKALRAKLEQHQAEIERLREELTLSEAMYRQAGVTAERENQRLRAALIAGRATHGELCRLGAECQFIRDADAALGRSKEC